jgi:hypothetical protein
MLRSDRPVIVEPEERPVSPPLRIRLGQIVHLNGAVPRDLPLENATPRRCRTCSALFFVVGKGSNRAAFCQECRAKKCPCCNHAGGTHYAYCSPVKPRPCRGCSVELGHGGSLSPYCEACRAEQCPECRTYGGRHGEKCLYERRRRRPGLTTVHNLVSEEDVISLYVEHRAYAVRLARAIVGSEAEDIVQDVVTYLLEKRDYLTAVPGKAYFFQAVKHTALRRLRYAWHRYTVFLDPEDAEAMMAGGQTSPEPVA